MSSSSRESNMCNDALHVVARSLFSERIGSWQKVALSCHMALDVLCQDIHEAWEMCGCQMSLVVKKGGRM